MQSVSLLTILYRLSFRRKQQNIQEEHFPSLLGGKHAVVFFRDAVHALHTEAVPVRVLLGLRQAVHKRNFFLTGAFHVDGEHIPIPDGGQGNEALHPLRQGGYRVDGIGQGVLEQGI